jgi:hypothetical protein
MELLVLIDKLDDVMHNARAVPLTDQVRVDKEVIYDLLDQMRANIPEAMKQAEYVTKHAPGDVGQQELREAVAAGVRDCIPEIAAAVAAAGSGGSGPAIPPPGGPF